MTDFATRSLNEDGVSRVRGLKTIMGCRYGSSRPQHDVAMYAELYLAGRFKLDELVTATYSNCR